jgi:hypothetical protein
VDLHRAIGGSLSVGTVWERAGISPKSVGDSGERRGQLERNEVHTQVTAPASKADLSRLASTWPKVLLLAPAAPAVSIGEYTIGSGRMTLW